MAGREQEPHTDSEFRDRIEKRARPRGRASHTTAKLYAFAEVTMCVFTFTSHFRTFVTTP
jgi:hypothetical protein